MLDPIVRVIEVPCSQQKAFNVFVSEMHNWWPLEKFSVSALEGKQAKGLRVNPKVGGQIVEIGHDNTEHLWGTITTFNPYDALSLDFHIAEPSTSASHVEVTFTVLAEERTRVELTQSNWEAFGDKAEMMRGGYGTGWSEIFERQYKAACGG